jgi:hypothetical protein
LFVGSLAGDHDVVGDILGDGRVAVKVADDTNADVRQPDIPGAGLTEQIV